MTKKILGKCGINCLECPAYISTKNNDDVLREKTAKEWSSMFNADIKPKDIDCLGCLSTKDPLFSHCKECKIRSCATDKGFDNCASCDNFGSCNTLNELLNMVPEAKANLEKLRK